MEKTKRLNQENHTTKFHTMDAFLYWIYFLIPFFLFFIVFSYRIDTFNLYYQRYPPNFTDQILYLNFFKKIMLSHRISSAMWAGSLCFIFFTSYVSTKVLNRKMHKFIGWIMVLFVLLNVFSGLLLMYIKTKNDTKAQNYGLLMAAIYSFISQFLLLYNIIIYPNRKYHKRNAIRLIVAPLASILQHILYFIFIQYKSNFSSIWPLWDTSIIASGFVSVVVIECYLWKI
ncbi:unnamed protein product [Cunninghamella blakesleeana]